MMAAVGLAPVGSARDTSHLATLHIKCVVNILQCAVVGP